MIFNNEVSSPPPGLEILAGGTLNITASGTSSDNDFDFLTGEHVVHHRKLKERLSNNNDWVEFEGAHEMKKILNGTGNIEKYLLTGMDGKPFEGMNLRLFDPLTRLWSIYWADSINGNLSIPVTGSFTNGIGHFYTTEEFRDKKIIILFRYDGVTNVKPTWSQAFSADNGESWEWNWQMIYK
jgi:hypothetical protein